MTISINSMTIILAVILVDFFMILLIIGYQKTLKDRSLKILLASKVCQMIAFLIFGLIALFNGGVVDTPFDTVSLISANVLYLWAVGLEPLAVLALFSDVRKTIVGKTYFIVAAALSVAYAVFYFGGADQSARIMLVAVGCIIFLVYPMVYLLFEKKHSFVQRLMGILYMLILIAFFMRILIAAGIFGLDFAVQNERYSWTNFSLFIMMILSGTGYFLLAKEQADIRLLKRANTDSLTGVLNRGAFCEQGERVMHYFERKKEPVSFLIFDIDDFKKVNDSYGHYIGDTALKEIVGMVQAGLRKYDFLGRYGGDEFSVLLPGADERTSDLVVERIRHMVEEKALYEHAKIKISVCIGIATVVPKKDSTIEKLYRMADDALYDAKLLGGNSIARNKGTQRSAG